MTENFDTRSEFTEWLNGEVEARGWSYRELARRGGVSHGAISAVASGQRPGYKVCQAISRAFGIPLNEVYRRAGLLPSLPRVDDPTTRELMEILPFLEDEDLGVLLRMAQALLKEQALERGSKRD